MFFSKARINLSIREYCFRGSISNSHNRCTVNGAALNRSRRSKSVDFMVS